MDAPKIRFRTAVALSVFGLLLGATMAGCGATNGDGLPSGEATLMPGPPASMSPGRIEGFVFDRDVEPAAPIAGAAVSTIPASSRVLTDAQGFYRIQGLPAGSYEVQAVSGNRGASSFISVGPGATASLDLGIGTGQTAGLQEVVLLTEAFTPGEARLATVNLRGAFFKEISVSGVGGPFRSVRFSRAAKDTVVVVSNFDSPSGEVYVVDVAAGTARRVTRDGVVQDTADLSPDGARVVYSEDADGDGFFEIVTSRIDGSVRTVLVADLDPATGRTTDNRDPIWSPDGSAILYSSRRTDAAAPVEETDHDLFLLPVATVTDSSSPRFDAVVATGAPRAITGDLDDDRNPTWHPAGTLVVFSRRIAGRGQLHLAPVSEGGSVSRLTRDSFDHSHPSFTEDGLRLVWTSTANPDGTNPDGGPEALIGDLTASGNFFGGLSNIRALTATPVNSQVSFTGAKPPIQPR